MSEQRKHRSTGAPKGGKRQGAGRPAGTFNALPRGTVEALKSLRLRVPDDAHPIVVELAGRSLERVVEVMEGLVSYQDAPSVLKAVQMFREEALGAVPQKLEASGPDGTALQIIVNKYAGPDEADSTDTEGEA